MSLVMRCDECEKVINRLPGKAPWTIGRMDDHGNRDVLDYCSLMCLAASAIVRLTAFDRGTREKALAALGLSDHMRATTLDAVDAILVAGAPRRDSGECAPLPRGCDRRDEFARPRTRLGGSGMR